MIRINLLPRAPRRRLAVPRVVELGIPLVTLAVVVVLGVVVYGQTARLEAEIAATNVQIAELKPAVERVLELDRQLAMMRVTETVIAELLKQQLPAASILNEIRLLIPRQVWITSLSVPEPAALSLEGMAMTYHAVAQFMDNLETGQLFRVVDLSVAQLDKPGATEVVKFQITARIVKPEAGGGVRP